jgi:hypothetical protein
VFAHDVHVTLAAASVLAVIVAGVEAAVRAVRRRPPGRVSGAMSTIVVIILGMTAAGGLAMLVRGERPKEPLHFVYAAVALALLPLGDSLAAGAEPRRRAAARVFAAVLALGVIARLFATG